MKWQVYMATNLKTRTTFIAELTRKGCRKIKWSAMPADRPGGDVLMLSRLVPVQMRRAARSALQ